jgi:hypothetical protein
LYGRRPEDSAAFGSLWLPFTIAAVFVAGLALLLSAMPENPQQASTDRPAISTDLDTTGRAIPKE